MSSHTLQSSAGPADPGAAPPFGADRASRAAVPGRGAELSDGIPACPPPEVLEAIAVAAQAYERLAETGRTVRFATGSGRLSIQLIDRRGALVRALSPRQVLDLTDDAVSD